MCLRSIIICNAKKPLFTRTESAFYQFDMSSVNFKGDKIENAADLKPEEGKKIFLEGNCRMLTEFFQTKLKKENVRTAYFGHHGFSDIQAFYEFDYWMRYNKKFKGKWDVIAIIEEMSFFDNSYEMGRPA